MHLPIPVDAVVLGMNPTDLFEGHLVTDCSGRRWVLLRSTVAARSEEPTFHRAQDAADDLDPEVIEMPVDESGHFVVGWSSSLAKNAETDLRISLARRDSASSRRSQRFSSSRDSAGRPRDRLARSGCTRFSASPCQHRVAARQHGSTLIVGHLRVPGGRRPCARHGHAAPD